MQVTTAQGGLASSATALQTRFLLPQTHTRVPHHGATGQEAALRGGVRTEHRREEDEEQLYDVHGSQCGGSAWLRSYMYYLLRMLSPPALTPGLFSESL